MGQEEWAGHLFLKAGDPCSRRCSVRSQSFGSFAAEPPGCHTLSALSSSLWLHSAAGTGQREALSHICNDTGAIRLPCLVFSKCVVWNFTANECVQVQHGLVELLQLFLAVHKCTCLEFHFIKHYLISRYTQFKNIQGSQSSGSELCYYRVGHGVSDVACRFHPLYLEELRKSWSKSQTWSCVLPKDCQS